MAVKISATLTSDLFVHLYVVSDPEHGIPTQYVLHIAEEGFDLELSFDAAADLRDFLTLTHQLLRDARARTAKQRRRGPRPTPPQADPVPF